MKFKVVIVLFFVSLFVVLLSCSSKKTVMAVYNGLPSLRFVEDSIKESGTEISGYRMVVFDLDDGSKDTVNVATLYKEGDATGSIQVRNEGGLFNVKVIDLQNNI